MFIAVLARRLKPGKSYEDFVEAWYPDKGFGFTGRGPFTARNIQDEREIITVGFLDPPAGIDIGEALAGVAAQEAVRHERIDAVIESTTLRGLYEVLDEFDFSTDESVERGRPG